MATISKAQLQKLHVLLRQRGIDDELKRIAISHLTAGRTTSSKELTSAEAKVWIDQLECKPVATPAQAQHASDRDSLQRMRRKVFALAYEAGIIWGDTPADKQMNAAKLEAFILDKGTIKKPLNQQSAAELVKTVSQMQQLAKHTDQSKAKKATDALLSELNISKS